LLSGNNTRSRSLRRRRKRVSSEHTAVELRGREYASAERRACFVAAATAVAEEGSYVKRQNERTSLTMPYNHTGDGVFNGAVLINAAEDSMSRRASDNVQE